MSYCREEGKDKIIFVTKEDHEGPVPDEVISLLDEEPEDDEPEGLILPSGGINWNCPCLGGMPSGPCGTEFREAFSCFHYSEADPKGSDCLEQFRNMQVCMSDYPDLYPAKDNNEDDENMAATDEKEEQDGADAAIKIETEDYKQENKDKSDTSEMTKVS